MTLTLTPREFGRLTSKFVVGDGCWQWTAGRNQGYGWVGFRGRNRRAHTIVYEWLVGPIPEGMVLDHLCRNRGCVRPDHLEPVTNRTNILRGFGAGAQFARRTHCAHGHELTPDNVYSFRGSRACRTCRRIRSKELRARRRAA